MLNTILTGDARILACEIADASIDLCITDPVWNQIRDYAWLAAECERVLKPGGSLFAQCGRKWEDECRSAMRESQLSFVADFLEVYPYGLTLLREEHRIAGYKTHLWFARGRWRAFGENPAPWIMDRFITQGKGQARVAKQLHHWGDSEEVPAGLICMFCGPESIVWDPFTGSGTVPAAARRLGVNFIAFERDPAAAEKARGRVADVFAAAGHQLSLDMEVGERALPRSTRRWLKECDERNVHV